MESDRRTQRMVMLLSTYSAAEDHLEMTTLLLLLMRRCHRPQYDFDLEMLVDELEDAAEDHKGLKAKAEQAEQTIKEFSAVHLVPRPMEVPELHRVHQAVHAAMEEAERWAGLLKATREQGQTVHRKLQERSLGLEKEKDKYQEELKNSERKNQELADEVARLRAQLLGPQGCSQEQIGATPIVDNGRKTRSSSTR